jgi:sugar phosphate isomerase/epimerase
MSPKSRQTPQPRQTLSRREFFHKAGTTTAAAGLLAAGAGSLARLQAAPLGMPIGSQTYPHRQMIKDGNFAGLAKQLKDIGVGAVELCSPIGYAEFAPLLDGKQTKQILADHGIICISAHFGMRELREKHAESIAWAKSVGITQMITATLNAGNSPTMDDVKKAADEYNKIAAVSAKEGLQQGLHNEGFEMTEVDGKRTYDLLFELLDPKLVKFQFQMSTIMRGFVAAEYFTKYPGRFFSMHVQDVDLNAEAPPPATPPRPNAPPRGRGVQTSAGKGSIDWVKTFQAAKTGGVKNYFVEQNMDLTMESVAYLKTLKV